MKFRCLCRRDSRVADRGSPASGIPYGRAIKSRARFEISARAQTRRCSSVRRVARRGQLTMHNALPRGLEASCNRRCAVFLGWCTIIENISRWKPAARSRCFAYSANLPKFPAQLPRNYLAQFEQFFFAPLRNLAQVFYILAENLSARLFIEVDDRFEFGTTQRTRCPPIEFDAKLFRTAGLSSKNSEEIGKNKRTGECSRWTR